MQYSVVNERDEIVSTITSDLSEHEVRARYDDAYLSGLSETHGRCVIRRASQPEKPAFEPAGQFVPSRKATEVVP